MFYLDEWDKADGFAYLFPVNWKGFPKQLTILISIYNKLHLIPV